MTKRYVDLVLIVDDGRVDDTAVLVKEMDAFVTIHKKENFNTSNSVKKGFHHVPENDFDYVEDIVK
jgi:glycosyltransferase involved in cell wall biosynthesis